MSLFEDQINKLLIPLSDKALLIFALLTAEGLYPNYVAFQQVNGWGDKELLLEAKSLIFCYIHNPKSVSNEEVQDMLGRVDVITPDMDDFSSTLASLALDACTSILSSLDYILDKDAKHIVNVSTYATDTVFAFIHSIQNISTTWADEQIIIDNNKFMINERNRQLELVNKLSKINLNNITDGLIDSLRSKTSIIDLSLLL